MVPGTGTNFSNTSLFLITALQNCRAYNYTKTNNSLKKIILAVGYPFIFSLNNINFLQVFHKI